MLDDLRRTDIRFYNFNSDGHAQRIEILIRLFEPMLPGWLHILSVVGEYEDDGAACRTHCNGPYRRATITVYAPFFAEPEDIQEHLLLHEIIHLYQEPIINWIENNLVDFIKRENADLGAALRSDFVDRFEAMTEDYTHLIGMMRGQIARSRGGAA